MLLKVFDIAETRDRIIRHLDIGDICTLTQTCRFLRDLGQYDYLWHSFYRTHNSTYHVLLKHTFLHQSECGRRHDLEGRTYTCANTPVTLTTQCLECSEEMRYCSSCLRQEFADVKYCDFCKMNYGYCVSCTEDDIIVNVTYIKCRRCHRKGCSFKHFGRAKLCLECQPLASPNKRIRC